MADKIIGIVNFEPPFVNMEGLGDYRPVSATSFMARYRVIDFAINNLINSKIQNIELHIKERPRSVVEHVTETNYNINRKKGKIHLLSGEQHYVNESYNTDIASFASNMQYILDSDAEYVAIAPSHLVYTQDFRDMVETLKEKEADIVVLYQDVKDADKNFLRSFVLDMDREKRVTSMYQNLGKYKNEYICLESYVMKKDLFVELVKVAGEVSSLYTFCDIVSDTVLDLKIIGHRHSGYAACLNSLKAYYDSTMDLRDGKKLKDLISEDWPIFTMTNDSAPTLYKDGAEVSGSVIGNGCIIEGKVINSVVARNVTIKKGAVVENAVILPNTTVLENAVVKYAVVDRFVTIKGTKKVIGSPEAPLYVKKGDKI